MAAPHPAYSLILLSTCGILLGCGQATLGRKAVYGEISGAEGRSGLVSFIPDGSGPATRVKVTNGSYRFDKSNGPSPGQYRVVVQLAMPRPEGVSTVLVKGVPVPVDQADGLETAYDSRSLLVSVSAEESLQLNLLLPQSIHPAVTSTGNSPADQTVHHQLKR
ncbi:MAG: hypothetical protein VB858_01890 [Planctomycetaceae bacterium]